jgi:hypothetical protein
MRTKNSILFESVVLGLSGLLVMMILFFENDRSMYGLTLTVIAVLSIIAAAFGIKYTLTIHRRIELALQSLPQYPSESEAEREIRLRRERLIAYAPEVDFAFLDEDWLSKKFMQLYPNLQLSKVTTEGNVKAKLHIAEAGAKSVQEFNKHGPDPVTQYQKILAQLDLDNKIFFGLEVIKKGGEDREKLDNLVKQLHDDFDLPEPEGYAKKQKYLSTDATLKQLEQAKRGYMLMEGEFTIENQTEGYLLKYTHPISALAEKPITITGQVPKKLLGPNQKALFENRAGKPWEITVLGNIQDSLNIAERHYDITLSIKAVYR